MSKTFTAPFAQTPKTANAVVTGAATIASDSPANTVLLLTAGTDGALLTRLTATPRATVTASGLVLFLSKDGGTTKQPISTALMAANTYAATKANPISVFTSYTEVTPLRLAAGDTLYVGSLVASAGGIVFSAEYTDF